MELPIYQENDNNMRLHTKLVLIIGFIFFSFVSNAQKIKFKLYVKRKCEDTLMIDSLLYLEKDNNFYYAEKNKDYVNLKEKGRYKVISMFMFDKDDKYYNIDHYGLIIDTIYEPAIKKCNPNSSKSNIHSKLFYCCCNGLCDGKKVDYYSNGNIWLEGNFRKGEPIGMLKEYHRNGKLKKVEKYNRHSKLIEREIFIYQNDTLRQVRIYGKYGWRLKKEIFYLNGKVEKIKIYDKKGRQRKVILFYPNGKIKQKIYYNRKKIFKLRPRRSLPPLAGQTQQIPGFSLS